MRCRTSATCYNQDGITKSHTYLNMMMWLLRTHQWLRVHEGVRNMPLCKLGRLYDARVLDLENKTSNLIYYKYCSVQSRCWAVTLKQTMKQHRRPLLENGSVNTFSWQWICMQQRNGVFYMSVLCYKQRKRLELSQFCTGVYEEKSWKGTTIQWGLECGSWWISLSEAVTRERLANTQQAGNDLACNVVICKVW
jgi:hypothetical protein